MPAQSSHATLLTTTGLGESTMLISKPVLTLLTATMAAGLGAVPAMAKPTTVNHITTSYSAQTHALTVKGHATGAKRLTLTYKGKAVKSAPVKSGQFKLTQSFKGYGTFQLKSGRQVLTTIRSQQYATPKVKVISAERTTKGIRYTFAGPRAATLKIAQNGRTIKTLKTTGTTTKVFISNAQIKNSTRGLTVTQRVADKKTSQIVQLPALKANIKQVTNF